MYAEVLVEYNAIVIDKVFTYLIREDMKNILTIGMKVKVPFNNRLINGFVLNITSKYNGDYEILEIDSIIMPELILNNELLELGKYIKEKTLCTLISAYQVMLPTSLKVKDHQSNYNKYDVYIELNKSEEEILSYIEANKRSKKQIEILNELLKNKKILKKSLSSGALNTLLEKNVIKEIKEQKYRLDIGETYNTQKKILTEEQKKAVTKIRKGFNECNTFLLHGVTGSGKTEVYINLIEETLANKKTAIMLVPEISLTTQIVNRFYNHFGSSVAVFHSALSEGEKYDEYLKILRGEVSIVVGTRSAVFTPLQNLGIIIIDEEHSENYKQDNNPRYHARDMAEFRSKYHNIPLVLGSATPSLETMARAKKDVYKLIFMPSRIGDATLPDCIIVDMVLEMKKRNMIFSELLKSKINDRLAKQEQIILLLNRRGFSTIITCQSCGYTYTCPHCDISLTYHKSTNNLRCHYCGYTVLKADSCPDCNEFALNYFGLGTEKLEEEIKSTFKNARVIRMDADTTQNKGTHKQIIDAFDKHEYDILLGTQMISKGLDFPKVSLVGVINADTTLNIPDFRSNERTFSLLSQVAGRAGRSEIKGEVVIQTFNPDNYCLHCVKNNDFQNFYEYEMDIRKKLGYPPYYFLISIKVVSKIYEDASQESRKVVDYLKKHLNSESVVLGPTTASMFKVNNKYRFQIVIKYRFDKNIIDVLTNLNEIIASNKNVNLEVDINPSSI